MGFFFNAASSQEMAVIPSNMSVVDGEKRKSLQPGMTFIEALES